MAPGRKNYNRFEINGSRGSLAFDLERMNELELYLEADQERVRGFRRILVTGAAHPVHEGAGGRRGTSSATSTRSRTPSTICSRAMAPTSRPQPNFVDGVRNQRVLARSRRRLRHGEGAQW